jgi:hypothetical protein
VSARVSTLQAIYLGFSVLLFGGVATVVFAPRLAVFLLLAGMIGLFATRFIVGVVEYRRTMRRPWPRVPPIDDDDDEW